MLEGELGLMVVLLLKPGVRRGGLALLLRLDTNVEILSYTLMHISARLNDVSLSYKWSLISFCGEPTTSRR